MVNLPAYALFVYTIYDFVYSMITGQPSLIATKNFPLFSLMWYVVAADTGLAVSRLFNRFIAVKEIYGLKNAFASTFVPPLIPLRLIWGNVINFLSTLDAWKTFIFGNKKKVKWNKTVHKEYAPDEILAQYKRKLGDILLENKIISGLELSKAIRSKGSNNELFGKYLVSQNYVTKKDMDFARASQLRSYLKN